MSREFESIIELDEIDSGWGLEPDHDTIPAPSPPFDFFDLESEELDESD